MKAALLVCVIAALCAGPSVDASWRFLLQDANATGPATTTGPAAVPLSTDAGATAAGEQGSFNETNPQVADALTALSLDLDAPVLFGLLNYSASGDDENDDKDVSLHQWVETAYVLYHVNKPTPLLASDFAQIVNDTNAPFNETAGLDLIQANATALPPATDGGNATAPILIDVPVLLRILEYSHEHLKKVQPGGGGNGKGKGKGGDNKGGQPNATSPDQVVYNAYILSSSKRPIPLTVSDYLGLIAEPNTTALSPPSPAPGAEASPPSPGPEASPSPPPASPAPGAPPPSP